MSADQHIAIDLAAFADAIKATGIEPPDQLQADGQLHRFTTNGKRDDRSGWYVLHDDGIPAGGFGCWRSGISETWCQDVGRQLTEAEEKANCERVAAVRRARDTAEKKRRQAAAKRAGEIWEAATPAPTDHPYLVNKGIAAHAHDLRVYDGRLVVPLRDVGGNLHSIQYIAPDGGKRYLSGGAVQGNHWTIGSLTADTPHIYIAEGAATAAAVHASMSGCAIAAMSAGNLKPVAEALHSRYPGARIIVCGDDDHATAGNPGVKAAGEAANAVAGIVAIPQFPQPRAAVSTDWCDLAVMSGLDAVKNQIDDLMAVVDSFEMPPPVSPTTNKEDARIIAELAALSPLDYDRRRTAAAKQLGVRASTLDGLIAERREKMAAANADQDGAVVEDLTPWATPVDGRELANTIARTLADHVALPAGACTAISLFAIGTFCMDAWRLWPKLLITSPEKRCGKSTLLEVVEATTYRPLLTSGITASSLFRCIEAWAPTLLIDEADTFAKDNEELNGIINAGHTRRTATVVRSEKVGDSFEPRKFSVWSAQVIARIKSQRDTLHDRSVHVQMRRKLPGESVTKLKHDLFERMRPLRQQAVRWAADNIRTLKTCTPEVPNHGNDRAQDNWTPLFAIAETIGGDWPQRVRKAHSTMAASTGDDSAGPMLLNDIRAIFNDKGRDVIHSETLVDELVELEERPWCEWKHGKAMTKASLARLLKPFAVKSHQIKIGTINKNGYRRADFSDVWARYLTDSLLPPFQNSTTLQPSQGAGSSHFQNSTEGQRVEFQKPLKASQGGACREVEFQKGGIGPDTHATFEDDL